MGAVGICCLQKDDINIWKLRNSGNTSATSLVDFDVLAQGKRPAGSLAVVRHCFRAVTIDLEAEEWLLHWEEQWIEQEQQQQQGMKLALIRSECVSFSVLIPPD